MQTNLGYFVANYVFIFVCLLLVSSYQYPWIIASLITGGVLWIVMFVVHPHDAPMCVGNFTLSVLQRWLLVAVPSMLIFLLAAGFAVLWIVSFTGFVVLLHASFRKPGLKGRINAVIDELQCPTPKASEYIVMGVDMVKAELDELHEARQEDAKKQEFQHRRESYHRLADQMRDKYGVAKNHDS